MLTSDRARQDYVKAIYQLGGSGPVAAVKLARYLGVSRAAVTKLRRALEKDGLIKTAAARINPIELTARGNSLALRMIRRHRLIETFLHRTLELPLDVLHSQAEAIEHVISDDVAARLERFLGNPLVDPHGHPITRIAHDFHPRPRKFLTDAATGTHVRIESIPDRDASVVRDLAAERVLPGLTAQIIARDGRRITLRSARRWHAVSIAAAASIQISIQRQRARAS